MALAALAFAFVPLFGWLVVGRSSGAQMPSAEIEVLATRAGLVEGFVAFRAGDSPSRLVGPVVLRVVGAYPSSGSTLATVTIANAQSAIEANSTLRLPFSWTGVGDDGLRVRPGEYRLVLQAAAETGHTGAGAGASGSLGATVAFRIGH